MTISSSVYLKAGCIAFQCSCNEQVFYPKPWKKIWLRSVLSFSRRTQKRTFNFEKWTSPNRRPEG